MREIAGDAEPDAMNPSRAFRLLRTSIFGWRMRQAPFVWDNASALCILSAARLQVTKSRAMRSQSITRVGTIGGMLALVLANITMGELAKAGVVAAVGTAVSFGLSVLMQRITKQKPPRK